MEELSEYFAKYISIMTALVTPIIGAIVAYIAYQQYRIRRFEVRMKMYDKRYAVFEAVMDYIAEVVRDARADMTKATLLLRSSVEAQFLFDEEIEKFINSMYHHAIEDNRLRHLLENEQDDERRGQLVDRQMAILEWFASGFTTAKEHFSPYLKLGRF